MAWDQHVLLTRHTLDGFKTKSPALWESLLKTVEVAPIERFLSKAFGNGCSWNKSKDSVFGSLGLYYKVLYAEGAKYWNEVEWSTGLNRQHIDPIPGPGQPNSQSIGQLVTPYDVLAIYSDEPDWAMDDDVPALMGRGSATRKVQGSGLRMLRHFWYAGEEYFGYDFGSEQETDKRMQLFYELSLVAFEVGEPYWGYRFLANSLHYLQDIAQPFHSKAIIEWQMVNHLSLVHGSMCDMKRLEKKMASPRACGPRDTLENAFIVNAWVVGAYHSIYEDFVRGALFEGTDVAPWVSDADGQSERSFAPEKLTWGGRAPNRLDAAQGLRNAHSYVSKDASTIGRLLIESFGTKYKTAAEKFVPEQLRVAGTKGSLAFRLGRATRDFDSFSLPEERRKALSHLVSASYGVLARAGAWGREFLGQSLGSIEDQSSRRWAEFLRQDYQARCANPPPSISPRRGS